MQNASSKYRPNLPLKSYDFNGKIRTTTQVFGRAWHD
jgi:hypothetical protein